MKAKEKANEMFANYRYILSLPDAPLGEQKDKIAVQCAITAVVEIREALKTPTIKETLYWDDVQEELEKL